MSLRNETSHFSLSLSPFLLWHVQTASRVCYPLSVAAVTVLQLYHQAKLDIRRYKGFRGRLARRVSSRVTTAALMGSFGCPTPRYSSEPCSPLDSCTSAVRKPLMLPMIKSNSCISLHRLLHNHRVKLSGIQWRIHFNLCHRKPFDCSID